MKCVEVRQKRVEDLKIQKPAFYMFLWRACSEASKSRIMGDARYDEAERVKDPTVLWEIIRSTHETNPSGGGDQMLLYDRELLVTLFGRFCQQDKAIDAFYTTYKEWMVTLKNAGIEVLTPAQEAMRFLNKLDPFRYGKMMTELTNQASRAGGLPFPQTLALAYDTASTHKNNVMIHDKAGGELMSVMVLADHCKPTTTAGKPNNKRHRGEDEEVAGDVSSRRGRGGGRGVFGGRDSTGRAGGIARGGAAGGRARGDGGGRRGGRAGRGEDRRVCHHCNVVGHIKYRCSSWLATEEGKKYTNEQAERAYVLEEEGGRDDPLNLCYWEGNFVVDGDKRELALFTSTEVLLDNQASRSVFHNADLLRDIEDIEPYSLGGIDASAGGLRVSKAGVMQGLSGLTGGVGLVANASANVISQSKLKDAGYRVQYDEPRDVYRVTGDYVEFVFKRKVGPSGRRSAHYSCDMADMEKVLIHSVTDNMRRYNKREVGEAIAARDFQEKLGNSTGQCAIDVINQGVLNLGVTREAVLRADAIFGPSVARCNGHTNKQTPMEAKTVLAPRVTQKEQLMVLDIMYVQKIPFVMGVLVPLGLAMCAHIRDRTAEIVGPVVKKFKASAIARGFDVTNLRADGEGAIGKMGDDLRRDGVVIDTAGPGQHVPVVERMNQTVKKIVRSYVHSLPYVMTSVILIACVLFSVSRVNMHPNSQSLDKTCPFEQFTGRKLDAKIDFRFKFGDYVQATVPMTNNSMATRTQGCIALYPVGNLTGSVKMLSLATESIVVRDQWVNLPISDLVCAHITNMAAREGFTRAIDPSSDLAGDSDESADSGGMVDLHDAPVQLPSMIPIDRGDSVAADDDVVLPDGTVRHMNVESVTSGAGVVDTDVTDAREAALLPDDGNPRNNTDHFVRRSSRWATSGRSATRNDTVLVMFSADDRARAEIRRQLSLREDWIDKDFALTISLKCALRERGEEAEPVVMAELQQMVDKSVWRGVNVWDLTEEQFKSIIPSKMFLKDKMLPSGAFDRFKARLVAGGHRQDRDLYEDLSSPTAATTSVFTIAAIAAHEHRTVEVIDIGGAFLNADMAPTGIKVLMRLDPLTAKILIKIDSSYEKLLEPKGTLVVELDKALYGCVEAAALWYKMLRGKLIAYGFVENPYDLCVFNKMCDDGSQITVGLHVDDLLVTCVNHSNIESFKTYLKAEFPEIRVDSGKVISYIGMTFDFTTPGEVRVTMDNCVKDIISSCGVTVPRATPAASVLFDVRETCKATEAESKWFHTHVAKMLYLAKRVRPECLTAVAFLSTRVHVCDIDDLAKLRRLLGYLVGTQNRGIVLKVGESIIVKAYIDAAYGVHEESGKSHTGCAIVIGEGGPVFAKSGKQKIVTKSSTEAELVGLSDTASQAIHTRNFIEAQGYEVGPAIIYQDNMSCMALIKRGSPASERSRHINIRHFWVHEKILNGELELRHLGTAEMYANVLTKPVQGAQFVKERDGLTNWY